MTPLRRWVPGPPRSAAGTSPPAFPQVPTVGPSDPSATDLTFCAALAANGGIAACEQGFSADPELVRMRHAGLLELPRSETAPFAVTRVTLSRKARALLTERPLPRPADGGKPAPARLDQSGAMGAGINPGSPNHDGRLRRNGFEVARGMISAALKAELASWSGAANAEAAAALEARLLKRIGQIEAPFPA